MSGQVHAPTALPRENTPRTPAVAIPTELYRLSHLCHTFLHYANLFFERFILIVCIEWIF